MLIQDAGNHKKSNRNDEKDANQVSIHVNRVLGVSVSIGQRIDRLIDQSINQSINPKKD